MTGMNDIHIKDTSVKQPSLLSFANDLANRCSLARLFSAVLAIYFPIVLLIGNYAVLRTKRLPPAECLEYGRKKGINPFYTQSGP